MSSPSPSSHGGGVGLSSAESVGEGFSALQQLTLYESRTLMVLVGADKAGRACRLLTLDRTSPCDLRMVEDPCVYGSVREAEQRALELISGSGAPLERTMRLAALLGLIRLPKLFLVVVVKRERVGSIGGRWIYAVSEWRLKAVGHRSFDTNKKVATLTARYKAMILADIELGRDFFFSYFYDLTHTLQHNLMAWKEDRRDQEERAKATARTAALQQQQQQAEAAAAAAAATTAAASKAENVTGGSSDSDLSLFDPLAFDPIANSVPKGRRRSTTQLDPPPQHSPPSDNAPALQTLHEEESPDLDSKRDESAAGGGGGGAASSTEMSRSGADLASDLLSVRKGDTSSPSASYAQVHPSGAGAPDAVAFTLTPAPLDLSPSKSQTTDVHSPLAASRSQSASGSASAAGAASAAPPNPASMPHASEFFFNGGKPIPGAGAGAGAAPNSSSSSAPPTYNEKWLWNLHLAREFLHVLPHGSYWLVPLIHGFCQQHAVRIGRKDLLVTLMARRSRHFAGTRFIKRGVSSLGHVANEVESEQIVCERHSFSEGMGAFSSVVMVRGSIPLYFAQENPKSFKPDIVVYNFDRDYVATKLHMQSLFQRYGSPVALLSLIKKEEKSPQETRLGMAFNNAVQRVQAQFRMERIQRDMAAQAAAAQAQGAGTRARGGTFAREQAARDRMAALQAEVNRASVHPFPTTGSTPTLSPSSPPPSSIHGSSALSTAARERDFASTRPPYNHPSYEPNTLLMCCYDFLTQRSRQANVLKDLRAIVSNLVEEIGVFTFVAKPSSMAATTVGAVAAAAATGTSAAAAAANLIPLSLLDAPVSPSLNSTPLQQALLGGGPSSPPPSSSVAASSPLPAAVSSDLSERSVLSVQKGVIRVNCVDCLDRTNVGQFCIGKAALKIQLRSLGIDDDAIVGGAEGPLSPQSGGGSSSSSSASAGAAAAAEVYPELVSILQDMYTQHGDRIAHQYAGSGAMHKEIIYDHDGGAEGQQQPDETVGSLEELDRDNPYVVVAGVSSGSVSGGPSGGGGGGGTPSKPVPGKNITQNALSAIKRYYSNNFSDNDKQGAINVFLGNYIPTIAPSSAGGAVKPQIWDLDVYTNLMDSDQWYARDGERFVIPYQPQALGFVHRARAGARNKERRGNKKAGGQASLTATALGLAAPTQPLSPQHQPNSAADGLSLSPFGAHTPSSPVSAATGARTSLDGNSSRHTASARFKQYFEEAYNPGVYESFDEELKRAFQTPVMVKTAAMSAGSTGNQQMQQQQQQQMGGAAGGSPALVSAATTAATGLMGLLPPLGGGSDATNDAGGKTGAPRHGGPGVPPSAAAAPGSAPSASAAAAAAPTSGSTPAPPPAAKANAVKRGFTSLFNNAKASFNAAMNAIPGSSQSAAAASKAEQQQQQQQKQQQQAAQPLQQQAQSAQQPAPHGAGMAIAQPVPQLVGPRTMPTRPAPPLPPKRGASPPIAGAVPRPNAASSAAAAPAATSASGVTVSHLSDAAGEDTSASVGGVQSLSALVKQHQIAAAVAAISASQDQSQDQSQNPNPAGAAPGLALANPAAAAAVAAAAAQPGPRSIAHTPPLSPAHNPNVAGQSAGAASSSSSSSASASPPFSAMPISYPSSFQSTSATNQTGWSPHLTQRRDAAVPTIPNLSIGGAATAASASPADLLAGVQSRSLAVDTSYLHTASDDARALAEYAHYCDTERLFDAPCLPFAAGLGALAAEAQPPVPQERLAALLAKPIEPSDGVAPTAAAESSMDAGATALSAQELLQASLRLSHQQMAELLVSNVRDLASMHALLHALGLEAAVGRGDGTGQPKRLRAAEPFVLAPLDPVASTPEERRADNEFIAQSMMAAQSQPSTARR